MFNLLIRVQSVMDASILIGGAALPVGMSYAGYAQRGAYPLLVTALLAGVFALAARPFLGEHRALRPLMLVWLGQNVLLCLSALLRLDLYVDVYGLTYLRVYAMIWMGLVAGSLSLTAWQVWRRRTNDWLVLRALILAVTTLYVCAFVNFAGVIAEKNLTGNVRQDRSYICNLGQMASSPVRHASCGPDSVHGDDCGILSCDALVVPQDKGWRDFSFRIWRVNQ